VRAVALGEQMAFELADVEPSPEDLLVPA
jgi:hypothetical protein